MSSQNNPSYLYVAVTPDNATNIDGDNLTRGLYVGTGGDLVAVDRDGTAITFVAVPTGAILPIRCVRVNSTSTTASDIVALF